MLRGLLDLGTGRPWELGLPWLQLWDAAPPGDALG